MSPIRPLERADLEQVANLYIAVIRPRTGPSAAELRAYFERLLFDHPWNDPELPGLVYDQPGRGIVGFVASHSRRIAFGDRQFKLGCSGQLVADPEYRGRGVGALLIRRYMKGPQDLTITDGATDEVRQMWLRLGGRVRHLPSNSWTRVISPAGYARRLVRSRLSRDARPPSRLLAGLDGLAARRLAPKPVAGGSADLTAADLVELNAELAEHFRLRPAYDERFAAWLLAELNSTVERGRPLCRAVSDASGRRLGFYAAMHETDGIVQVLQIAAAPPDAGAVLDRLFLDAAERGAVAVEGRLEPHVYAAVRGRGCLLRRSEWALAHSAEPGLLDSLDREDALLGRLEGEWWMVPHRLRPGRPRPVA